MKLRWRLCTTVSLTDGDTIQKRMILSLRSAWRMLKCTDESAVSLVGHLILFTRKISVSVIWMMRATIVV